MGSEQRSFGNIEWSNGMDVRGRISRVEGTPLLFYDLPVLDRAKAARLPSGNLHTGTRARFSVSPTVALASFQRSHEIPQFPSGLVGIPLFWCGRISGAS
ncbi:MAG TPA: hypothetical protein VFV34_09540 [Blastocatellia bacterium]|nr:hypothetical protein [Blastocatellia bacterium]